MVILKEIPLKDIDEKLTKFQYRAHTCDPKLTETIKKTAVCDPVYVYQKGETFYILDGFKRIQALKKHAHDSFKVPSVLFTPKSFSYQVHLSILLKQDAQSLLPFSEKVSAAHMLKKAHYDKTFSNILQDLGLPNQPDYNKTYSFFKSIPIPWFQFFTDHRVPGRRIKGMCNAIDLKACTSLLAFNLGLNRLEHIVTMLSEIESREGKAADKILKNFLSENPQNYDPESLYTYLRTLRYPLITDYEKKITHAVKNLQLPSFVSVQVDKDGECPDVNLSVALQNEKDIESFLSWYQKSIKSLKKILHERLEIDL